MFQIQTNASGTRHLTITEEHLLTIEKYSLFRDLIDSHGLVTESVLDKLKLNVRSMMETEQDCSDLVSLCQEVLFHDNMKAFGLHQLITLYVNWAQTKENLEETEELD